MSVARGKVRDVWRGKHGKTGWWPYVSPMSPENVASASLHDGVDVAALEDLMALARSWRAHDLNMAWNPRTHQSPEAV